MPFLHHAGWDDLHSRSGENHESLRPSVISLSAAEDISLSSASALCFLVWDVLITLDDEVEYIWLRKWSLIRFAYLVSRYFSLATQIPLLLIGPNSHQSRSRSYTLEQCRFWQVYRGVVSAILLVMLDIILIARVLALYHEQPKIRRLVITLFGVEVVCMTIGLSLANPMYAFDEVCIVVNAPAILNMYGGSTIGFQAVLFGLTIFRFVQDLRAGWAKTPLFILLVRDGTWAFLLFLSVQFAVYYFIDNTYKRLFFPWMWSICAFCGCRMLLNLRKFANVDLRQQMGHFDSIRFKRPGE